MKWFNETLHLFGDDHILISRHRYNIKSIFHWAARTGLLGSRKVEPQFYPHKNCIYLLSIKSCASFIGILNLFQWFFLLEFNYKKFPEIFYFRVHYFNCLWISFKHPHQCCKVKWCGIFTVNVSSWKYIIFLGCEVQ